MKVYIVDDSISDALLAEETLTEYDKNIDFLIESNPLVAKEKILEKQSEIDLILLDLNMPKFDGIQMLEYMSENNINIPVIVYSNFIDQYEQQLNKNKVLQTVSKIELSNYSHGDMADIFMKLNSTKSCMILSEKLNNLHKKNMRKAEFYDEINSLKKELQNFI